MSIGVIIGAQWGDEGKGKIVDFLSDKYGMIVRFQGGANAGHTVMRTNFKTILHLLPSGILHPDKINIIGNGVVVDPVQLIKEIEEVKKFSPVTPKNLLISDRAHLVMPYHKLMDRASENSTFKPIGTTGRGIGPTYSDKYARRGIRVGDMLNIKTFAQKLKDNIEHTNTFLEKIYGVEPINIDKVIEEYTECAEKLGDYITDVLPVIKESQKKGRNILFEGAQGTLLDIDFGTYPYVTSSHCCCGGVFLTGVSPFNIKNIYGIIKAYCTRVGEGPFPTELTDSTGDFLREKGKEFGATTGRPRRCGWFDGVLAKYAVEVNNFTDLVLTKLDVLSGIEKLKICVKYELEGKQISSLPSCVEDVYKCKPLYEELEGWQEDISNIRDFDSLPSPTKKYIQMIEEITGVKVSIISTGPHSDSTILR